MESFSSVFPKNIKLKDGLDVTLRLMNKDDEEKLLSFFRKLPSEVLIFIAEDVTNRAVVKSLVNEIAYDKVLPLIVECNGEIIADSVLRTNRMGWMRHVGEIRVIIAPQYQKRGLGTILVKELIQQAVIKGLEKIMLQFMANQENTIKAMERIGFIREAVLKNHVVDWEGTPHDLVVLSNNVAELWRKLEDIIIDSEFIVQP